MPTVSIVMPTYNRVDVIGRAVASVILQTWQDWELIIVDDGSSDGTVQRLEGLDPRIRLIRQPNQGVATARNTALAAAQGRYIAFLDSDDEWLPQFLELTVSFLLAHPDQHWVATESFEDHGDGAPLIRHSHHDIANIYCRFARSIGSRRLDLRAGETDDYLRVYERRQPVGAWGSHILRTLGQPRVMHYQGHILGHMRWGYLHWLPAMVCTREAVLAAGSFVTHARSATDYRFFAGLARHFEANLLAIPLAIKYERAAGNQPLAQGHLATGAGAYRFELNKISFFEEMFGNHASSDPEIRLLHRHYCLQVAHRALAIGERRQAIRFLQHAFSWRRRLWRAWPMLALAYGIQDDRTAAWIYTRWCYLLGLLRGLAAGRISLDRLLDGLIGRLRGNAARDISDLPLSERSVTDIALERLRTLRPDTRPHPAQAS